MQLPKVKVGKSKRIGRGIGSGKGGHTVGRGQKGQRSRGKIGILFEGVKMKKSLLKRLPLARGKGKFKPSHKPIIIKLELLNLFTAGSIVSLESLAKIGIVKLEDAKRYGVKILGDGKLTKKLKIEVPMSKSVAKMIAK